MLEKELTGANKKCSCNTRISLRFESDKAGRQFRSDRQKHSQFRCCATLCVCVCACFFVCRFPHFPFYCLLHNKLSAFRRFTYVHWYCLVQKLFDQNNKIESIEENGFSSIQYNAQQKPKQCHDFCVPGQIKWWKWHSPKSNDNAIFAFLSDIQTAKTGVQLNMHRMINCGTFLMRNYIGYFPSMEIFIQISNVAYF